MKRTTVNKVLIIAGGLTVLTGLFLMFHLESHFAKAVHQIGGVALIIYGIRHIWLNRAAAGKAFKGGKRSLSLVILIFAVSVAVMAATGDRQPSERHQLQQVEQSVE